MSEEGETPKDKPKESRILTVYDLVAKLLPIEGRDYELNPSINERGGVSFRPEYHTEIGRIWVAYLAKTLPQLAVVPPLMRDQYIENIYPVVEVKQERNVDSGRARKDEEAGSAGADGKTEESKTV